MAKAKPAVAMRKYRAQQFCASARSKLLEWEVVASNGAIFIQLALPNEKPKLYSILPDDASDFREALGYAIDRVLGI